MSASLFISDLHLDPSRPRATTAFLRFLSSQARDAAILYILGDLFEFWIGDDDDDRHAREVLDALAAYTAQGHRCLLMRGNRDFLLGHGFGNRTGSRLLDDPTLTEIHGRPALLMHGDLLCTDDHAYQRYRRVVTNRALQRLFLALPRRWRRAAGETGRQRSRDYTATRQPEIMDVNTAAVTAALIRYETSILIHGHTHRPGIHHIAVNGKPATRIVLGDWYEQGSVLEWSPQGYELKVLPFV